MSVPSRVTPPRSLQTFAFIALLALASPALTSAQDTGGQDEPPHLAVVDGVGYIDREREMIDAVAGEVLVPGDRLRTESARAELWYPNGSTLDIDVGTVIDYQSDALIGLTAGRVMLEVSRDGGGAGYQIDSPAGSVAANGAGAFKIAITGGPGDEVIELAVVRGSAQLLADGGAVVVRSGERAFARANDKPSRPQPFSTAHLDAFDQWIQAQHDSARSRNVSGQYLPPNLKMYGSTFDQYGSWDYEGAYGYVWYPTVAPTWRPYYHGYWRPLPKHGWTWIGADRWGWPTHHYGRWGYNHSRWFWIPERRFAPAWVSWASAADYVSWCPLGFDNRPVFGFSVSVGNTWAGWTVLPRNHFGVRTSYVNRYAIEGRRLPRSTPFAVHGQPPLQPTYRGGSDGGQYRGNGQNRGRGNGQDPGRYRADRPAQAGVAVPRSPQVRTDYGSGRRVGKGSAAPTAPSADVRTRAYRRNAETAASPASVAPGGGDQSRDSRATPRHRVAMQAPPRESTNQGRVAAPLPSSAAPEPAPRWQDRAMRRAQQNGGVAGRSSQAPAQPAAAPEGRTMSRREGRASGPPRESAPASSGKEGAQPRGGGARGSDGGNTGGSGGNGGGGHGRRHP